MEAWIERELENCEFPDQRLKPRLGRILQSLSDRIGETIPTACRDWAATKAAYRFFSNPRVNEGIILAGHFAATRARATEALAKHKREKLLVLHDTTEVSFKRSHPEKIGQTRKIPLFRSNKKDGSNGYTACGMLLHGTLVTTTAGVPLGLVAAKFWTRKKFKGTNALKKKVNPTRIPIEVKESYRWIENVKRSTAMLGCPGACVHICDREGDIYELFCAALEAKTHFLIRTCADRLAGQGKTTVSKKMAASRIRGHHAVEVQDRRGHTHEIKLNLRFERLTLHPPIGKQKKYPPIEVTVIHAWERGKPKDREPIEWKLVTDLTVTTVKQAAEKLDWYASRWKIETYHKVLKSGCKIEDRRLETADRLANLLAVYCVVAWRVFYLTMVRRIDPTTKASAVLTSTERKILKHIGKTAGREPRATLDYYLGEVARLGGYLARKNDGPPGNMVMWRGLSRLADIEIGFEIGR